MGQLGMATTGEVNAAVGTAETNIKTAITGAETAITGEIAKVPNAAAIKKVLDDKFGANVTLRTEFDALVKKTDSAAKKINAIDTTATGIDTALTTVGTNVTDIGTKVTGMESTLGGVKTVTDTTATEVGATKAEVAATKAELISARAEILKALDPKSGFEKFRDFAVRTGLTGAGVVGAIVAADYLLDHGPTLVPAMEWWGGKINSLSNMIGNIEGKAEDVAAQALQSQVEKGAVEPPVVEEPAAQAELPPVGETINDGAGAAENKLFFPNVANNSVPAVESPAAAPETDQTLPPLDANSGAGSYIGGPGAEAIPTTPPTTATIEPTVAQTGTLPLGTSEAMTTTVAPTETPMAPTASSTVEATATTTETVPAVTPEATIIEPTVAQTGTVPLGTSEAMTTTVAPTETVVAPTVEATTTPTAIPTLEPTATPIPPVLDETGQPTYENNSGR